MKDQITLEQAKKRVVELIGFIPEVDEWHRNRYGGEEVYDMESTMERILSEDKYFDNETSLYKGKEVSMQDYVMLRFGPEVLVMFEKAFAILEPDDLHELADKIKNPLLNTIAHAAVDAIKPDETKKQNP